MRIIAGSAKGRRLATPQKRHITRPTTDRVREAIFSILTARGDIYGKKVLDLYAGTGALGCEALSRGAVGAVFVDHSRSSEALVVENLRRINRRGLMVRQKVSRFLSTLEADTRFDIVFLDPPYADIAVHKTLAELMATDRLNPGALVVAEHSRDEDPAAIELEGLAHVFTRRYGDSAVSLFERDGGEDEDEQEDDVPGVALPDPQEEETP